MYLLSNRICHLFTLLLLGVVLPQTVLSEEQKVGIVIMHGKGGSPNRLVDGLANELAGKGLLVANIEMPWSGDRHYDVSVSDAEHEVETALTKLRSKGATKVFVAGHSQGGAFALHFAGKHRADGIICIAPGGNVGNKLFRDNLGEAVSRARQLVAEGKGNERVNLEDFEGKRGTFAVLTTPTVYLTWFDPDGAMNMQRAAEAVDPSNPILWLVATRDYPGLRKTNIPMFNTLPKNPHTRMFEPDADHRGAPTASADEIMRWIGEVIVAKR